MTLAPIEAIALRSFLPPNASQTRRRRPMEAVTGSARYGHRNTLTREATWTRNRTGRRMEREVVQRHLRCATVPRPCPIGDGRFRARSQSDGACLAPDQPSDIGLGIVAGGREISHTAATGSCGTVTALPGHLELNQISSVIVVGDGRYQSVRVKFLLRLRFR